MNTPYRLAMLILSLSCAATSAFAGSGTNPPSSSLSMPTMNTGATTFDIDATYDFNVFAADDVIVWYLTIYYKNGGSSVHTFSSEAAAMETAAFYAFHIVEFSSFDLGPVVELSDFVFIQRFDKLEDAEDLADLLVIAGLTVDIRWVKERRRALQSTRSLR